MRRVRIVLAGSLALTSFAACGGKTEDTTPPETPDDTCGPAIPFQGNFGSGPLDALFAATRAGDEVATSAQTDFYREVAELASIFQVVPGPGNAKATVSDLVKAIEWYFAAVTQGGVTMTLSSLSCSQNDAVTDRTNRECRVKESCDDTFGECAASDICTRIARLNGLASLTCVGPAIDATFTFAPTATTFDQAETYTRVSELRTRGATLFASYARLSAFVEGQVNDGVIFDPPPLVQLTEEFTRFATSDGISELNLAPGCIPYTAPAFAEHIGLLNGLATGASELLADGKRFASLF